MFSKSGALNPVAHRGEIRIAHLDGSVIAHAHPAAGADAPVKQRHAGHSRPGMRAHNSRGTRPVKPSRCNPINTHRRPFSLGRKHAPRTVVVQEEKHDKRACWPICLDAYRAFPIQMGATQSGNANRHCRRGRKPFFDH
jgi:hypothetical protein